MSKDLRQFLQAARIAGNDFYVETTRPPGTDFEVTAIQSKLAKEGRFPVVFCPVVRGGKLPLVTNTFASHRLLALALGTTPKEAYTATWRSVFERYLSLRGKRRTVQTAASSDSPVHEVVMKGARVDLGILSVPRHSELDGGPYITAGMMILRDPDTRVINVGMYRHQVEGKDAIACNINPRKHGSRIARRHSELGKRLEAVLFIGHHPAVAIGSITNNLPDADQFEHICAVLGEPLEVTQGLTVDLPVPACAEIAIEGVIDPTARGQEGPFGDYWGYYGEARECYMMRVTAMTMRRDAIYHDLSPIHQEHGYVTIVEREWDLWERVRKIVPILTGLHIAPDDQCGKALLYLSIKKQREMDGRDAGIKALQSNPGSKVAIVVDDDIDIYDQSEVLWAVGTRLRPDSGVHILPNMTTTASYPLRHDESGTYGKGLLDTKLVLDATIPLDFQFPGRALPPKHVLNMADIYTWLSRHD